MGYIVQGLVIKNNGKPLLFRIEIFDPPPVLRKTIKKFTLIVAYRQPFSKYYNQPPVIYKSEYI